MNYHVHVFPKTAIASLLALTVLLASAIALSGNGKYDAYTPATTCSKVDEAFPSSVNATGKSIYDAERAKFTSLKPEVDAITLSAADYSIKLPNFVVLRDRWNNGERTEALYGRLANQFNYGVNTYMGLTSTRDGLRDRVFLPTIAAGTGVLDGYSYQKLDLLYGSDGSYSATGSESWAILSSYPIATDLIVDINLNSKLESATDGAYCMQLPTSLGKIATNVQKVVTFADAASFIRLSENSTLNFKAITGSYTNLRSLTFGLTYNKRFKGF